MEKVSKRATIVSWDNDGEIFRLRYTQDDGQKVVAIVKRVGWAIPPADVMEEVMDALRAGPRTIVGKPRRQPTKTLRTP
jgi:hypothetical protein